MSRLIGVMVLLGFAATAHAENALYSYLRWETTNERFGEAKFSLSGNKLDYAIRFPSDGVPFPVASIDGVESRYMLSFSYGLEAIHSPGDENGIFDPGSTTYGGSALLSDTQASDLLSGRTFLSVRFPESGAVLRGQISVIPEPASSTMLLSISALLWRRQRSA